MSTVYTNVHCTYVHVWMIFTYVDIHVCQQEQTKSNYRWSSTSSAQTSVKWMHRLQSQSWFSLQWQFNVRDEFERQTTEIELSTLFLLASCVLVKASVHSVRENLPLKKSGCIWLRDNWLFLIARVFAASSLSEALKHISFKLYRFFIQSKIVFFSNKS